MKHAVSLKKVNQQLDRIAQANREAALRGVRAAAFRIQQLIITETIPRTIPQPVDRGLFRAGWAVDLIDNGARLRNWVPWAAFIEYGVNPKKVKIGRAMIEALAEWVRRKGIGGTTKNTQGGPVLVTKPGVQQAMAIAWAIATNMKKTGIHGGSGGKGILGGRGILRRTMVFAPKILEAEVTRELEKVP